MSHLPQVFRSRRIAVLAMLGFSSGLPLTLTGKVLGAWLTTYGLSLKTIGAFAAVGLPYTFKWAWAPLLDSFRLPWLGRRRGWMVVFQVALIAAIAALGMLNPGTDLAAMAVLAVVLAALSASQDIVIDAYRTDILEPHERAAGSAVYVMGYRVALLITGTAGLILADYIPWRTVYFSFAALMVVGLVATALAREPEVESRLRSLRWQDVLEPWVALLRRKGIVVVLLFAACYKLGDGVLDAMTTPFLNRHLGFSLSQMAIFSKVAGSAGIFVGGFLAGGLATRLGLGRMLVIFGVLQASSNGLYSALAIVGKSPAMLAASVFVDNLAGAMGTAAYMAFLMSQCEKRFSAAHYAVLSSMSSVGNRVFGGAGGFIVSAVGWPLFFAITGLLAIPGLLLVRFLPLSDAGSAKPAAAGESARVTA